MVESTTASVLLDESQPADYTQCSQEDLITRINTLESLLRSHTADIAALTSKASTTTRNVTPNTFLRSVSPSRRGKVFDPSFFATRRIALKFSYLGSRYNGFEHANGTVPPKPTIEEVMWKALRKARLISPTMEEGVDDSFEVMWDPKKRAATYFSPNNTINEQDDPAKVRLVLNWEGCQYSKCGRTDVGVSAFGQVIGIRVRSSRRLRNKPTKVDEESNDHGATNGSSSTAPTNDVPIEGAAGLAIDTAAPAFDEAKELPYMSILNNLLPPDIRVLAVCLDLPAEFDARFSCRERRYKYFFTNPAFSPTPGPFGMQQVGGKTATYREGWLDIEKMKIAAKKLEGLHDFRNLCKIDASKQMPSCDRRITYADVQEWPASGSTFSVDQMLNADANPARMSTQVNPPAQQQYVGPKVYHFAVHGTAFLWHQVRCMVAILFLVGQGLEQPDIVDKLLDIKHTPRRPTYEMADDSGLVLWDCIFPKDEKVMEDSLPWIYAGDASTILGLATKNDGKFGLGGVVDELWGQWRQAKMNEILSGSLLDLALGQGDGSALQRGGFRDTASVTARSQKVFDGGNVGRMIGKYVPVMQKPKVDSLEDQNAKYANGRMVRRQAKKAQEEASQV